MNALEVVSDEERSYQNFKGTVLRSGKEPNRFNNDELHVFFRGSQEHIKRLRDEYGDYIDTFKFEPRKEILLPGTGKMISTFAHELAWELKDKDIAFYRIDTKEIVEVGEIVDKDDENVVFQGFRPIKPNRFITLVERYLTPGVMVNVKEKVWEFKQKSMSPSIAETVLQSQVLQDELPKINRIFTVPVPVMHKGELTFPHTGYDSRFKSWLLHDAPRISIPDMPVDQAKDVIETLFAEFPFEKPEDKAKAIAGLLTPFLRGLFPRFTTRSPLIVYKANRERAGKDYCAGLTGIVYSGDALEDSPIEDNDELRKKICAGLMGGRKRFHFSNNKGYINSSTFEGIITAENWSDRILGRSENVTIANELDFSLSGNVGISFTPDLANRSIFINLFLAMEDANSRAFSNPGLHTWAKENRSFILSALYSFVRHWFDNGKPHGTVPFASFPDWARICGGIMESLGYPNPCLKDKEQLNIGVDNETKDMKVLFELGYNKCTSISTASRGGWLTRSDLMDLVKDEDAFAYYNFENRTDQTKFGLKVAKFIGRYLSDIKLEVDDPKVRGSRQRYRFSKENLGNDGNDGNVYIPENNLIKNDNIYIGGNT